MRSKAIEEVDLPDRAGDGECCYLISRVGFDRYLRASGGVKQTSRTEQTSFGNQMPIATSCSLWNNHIQMKECLSDSGIRDSSTTVNISTQKTSALTMARTMVSYHSRNSRIAWR